MFITLRHSYVEVDIHIDARYTAKTIRKPILSSHTRTVTLTQIKCHVYYVTACVFSIVCFFYSCLALTHETKMFTSNSMMSMFYFTNGYWNKHRKKEPKSREEDDSGKEASFPFSVREQNHKKIYTKHIQCWRPLKTLHLILIHSLHTMTLSFLLYMVCVCAKNGLGLYFAVRCSLLSIFLFCFATLWNNTLYALFIWKWWCLVRLHTVAVVSFGL